MSADCDYNSFCTIEDTCIKSATSNLAVQYYDKPRIKKRVVSLVSGIDEILEIICTMGLSISDSGEGLTKMGKLIGFPRCHCKIIFCCGESELVNTVVAPESYCFDDDDLYRRYLRAWTVRKRSSGLVNDLILGALQLYGENCRVTSYSDEVVIKTGRALSPDERMLLGYTARVVLPKSPFSNTKIIETTSLATCPL